MKLKNLVSWLASRPRKSTVSTIVLHGTAGASAESSINWLRISGNSYHYVIERDGTVTKTVPVSRCAYHAGRSSGPNGSIRGSVNDYSIGICFANREDGRERLTLEQLEACEILIEELKSALPTIRWVTTHKAVAPGRKVDPIMFRKEMINLPRGVEYWKL